MLSNLLKNKGLLMSGMLTDIRIPEHPKNKCLPQTAFLRKRWHIVFLIFGILVLIFNLNLVFADLNYTTGNAVYGILADTGNTNITGALNLTLQMRVCSLANCSDANWSAVYTNSNYTSLASLANATYFQYKATFFTENLNYTPYLFNITTDYTYLDTTYPLINFTLSTPENNSGASGSFVINVSIIENNLANLTLNWNGALTAFNLSNESLHNLGSGNWVFTYTQSGLVVGQSYTYSVSVSDYAGNSNQTETRTIKGAVAPSYVSINQTPLITDYDNLDPGLNVTVTVNLSDTDNNFDTAILQWKNSTQSDWNNLTMNVIGVKGIYTLVNKTLTLPNYEGNITYRIWANDTVGENRYSNNYTLQSYWDCTWRVYPSSLEEVVGFYEDKSIGNITLINTGDIQYSNNNCSINFAIGYIGFSQNYAILTSDSNNWASANNRYFQYTNPIIVNASSNQTFNLDASFPSTTSPFTETPSITITSSINDTITKNKTASVLSTLIIAPPNPLIYQEITTYPTNYVYLTSGNFSLKAYVRNLGYDASNSFNTTAYNVSFNWTLPSAISSRILEGNETSFYEVLNTSSRQYNNLTIGLTSSNLASMPKGAFNVLIYSYGYKNNSGNFSLINNSGGYNILNETVSVQFLCYDAIDGICVSACGIGVDPDCSASSTNPGSGSGSGGGGGGSAANPVVVATSAEFQLVRGEENKVKIIFQNKNTNSSLKDISFSISGKISRYIDISPKQLSSLGAGEKITLILKIISPTYIELGKQELTVTMKGKMDSLDYTDSKKITLEIHELSLTKSNGLLDESRKLIDQLNKANLSSDTLNNLLVKSEEAQKNFNLEVIRDNHNLIKAQVGYALDSKKIIKELDSLTKSAEEKGIDVSESVKLLKLAKLSIERREFEQAYKRAKDSQLTYALEVKGEFGKLSYYLKEYPGEISLCAFFLVIFSFGAYNINKLRIIKKRIKKLKGEEKIINELIRVVQNECFKEKKMSMKEYETAMKEYNTKLSKVIEELIELETKRAGMLRFTSKTKRLKLEKEKIISLIKELQEDYMKKKKLETRTFELKMESFNRRISEIEEKLATLEAKKAVRSFGVSLKIPMNE